MYIGKNHLNNNFIFLRCIPNAMYGMAITLSHQGKYEKALEKFQEVLEERERILGDDHRDTVETKRTIVEITAKLLCNS
ncbi:tetratricopeptide repeat protein [Wolbachia endosymbiont of Brugia pahangi]|uniref:tetratricopeptide repeat protein n=1 Tax=Wolbachia endosymbiont of Brugia pahangi TaxID=96495 RepID=UPI001435B0CC|nr:tetratricopeptide repeat protein [Wolbachia endosymbiont of Brugia pahangi]QIT36578.1 tetratricopeptide repeat family protein [Wolbachia endosymbiont of Brugia pahangi]